MAPCDAKQISSGCETLKEDNGDVKGCFTKDGEKCPKQEGGMPKITSNFKNNYFRYKINYMLGGDGHETEESTPMQSGGDGHANKWTNKQSQEKFNYLVGKIGDPNKICSKINGDIEYALWQQDFDKVKFGNFGGLDYLKLSNHHAQKYHPYPAPVFIIAGKYMKVPDRLIGPLKHASETINIEQLFVDKNANDKYGKDGTKDIALVTGSCASINISTITVAFAEDMIKKHKDIKEPTWELHEEFREEYDRRITRYLGDETKGQYDNISWYKPEYFGEEPSTA
tara:strand:- start:1438 stop:2286 length:849 start_codon:yes stop_codon:yes gene_type:complete